MRDMLRLFPCDTRDGCLYVKVFESAGVPQTFFDGGRMPTARRPAVAGALVRIATCFISAVADGCYCQGEVAAPAAVSVSHALLPEGRRVRRV